MLINSQNRKKIGIDFFLIITISLTSITLFLFSKNIEEMYYDPDYYIQYLRTISVPLTENIAEDLDKAIVLMNFTHYYMTFKSVNLYKRIDVIALVENREGLCSEYATLFACLCTSIGINGRRTGLLLGDMGHQLTEIYINGKWQVFDPLYNFYFNETTQEINVSNGRDKLQRTFQNFYSKEINWW